MKNLYLSALKNLLIATALCTALFLVMLLFNVKITYDKTLLFSVIATISGVAYILTIRNPSNYVGFYLGILSSVGLGVQFAISGKFDLTFLYFLIFIPFQISAIRFWKLHSIQTSDNQPFKPKFLPTKRQLFFALIFILIVAVDYIFVTHFLNPYKNQSFFSQFEIKTVFAAMISSSILANYLMIGKWLDTWIYWLIYSAFAIISSIIILNSFNLLLFIFFLIINTLSFASWLKAR